MHEHPARATSWTAPCIKQLMEHPMVQVAEADRCAYGLMSVDGQGEAPARTPTRV